LDQPAFPGLVGARHGTFENKRMKKDRFMGIDERDVRILSVRLRVNRVWPGKPPGRGLRLQKAARGFLVIVLTAGSLFAEGPGLSPEFYRGVCYAHVHKRGHGYGTERSAQELKELRKLGVNWIALIPFGYQENVNSEKIVGYPDMEGVTPFFSESDPTMRDQDIVKEIETAHALGMKVFVKPHIWAGDFVDEYEWPGTIRQGSKSAHKRWWASYRAYILHYAQVAANAGADMFCVGSELAKMTSSHPNEWRELIKEIRAIPARNPMHLTYSAHWEKEFQLIPFWDALDYIGIAAYFPLEAPENATADELLRVWRPHQEKIERVASLWKKQVVFTEVGYRPMTDTHRQPWNYSGGKPHQESQTRAYEALLRMLAGSNWARGLFIWKTYTDPQAALRDRAGGDYQFRGRPAEKVLGKWYGGSSGAPMKRR
jgi:hypothetical protein